MFILYNKIYIYSLNINTDRDNINILKTYVTEEKSEDK